jgi:hypothetical protein
VSSNILSCSRCPAWPPRCPATSWRAPRPSSAATAPSAGAYTHSKGLAVCARSTSCEFIAERDGRTRRQRRAHLPLSDGASPAVKVGLTLLLRGKSDGILLPIPQYPLYSATIALLGGTQVPYYLDEANHWGLSVARARAAVRRRQEEAGVDVRALVVINPGNPTGQVMSYDNIAEVVQWAAKRDVAAAGRRGLPGQRLRDRQAVPLVQEGPARPQVAAPVPLVPLGLQGRHGRVRQARRLHGGRQPRRRRRRADLQAQLDQPVPERARPAHRRRHGQAAAQGRRVLRAPHGRDEARSSTRSSAAPPSSPRCSTALEGVTCNSAQGAMYAFPQVRLPPKAIAAAKSAQSRRPTPTTACSCSKHTGICVVPGSGFGQRDGTHHFRTTFLPREDKVDKVARLMTAFHSELHDRSTRERGGAHGHRCSHCASSLLAMFRSLNALCAPSSGARRAGASRARPTTGGAGCAHESPPKPGTRMPQFFSRCSLTSADRELVAAAVRRQLARKRRRATR